MRSTESLQKLLNLTRHQEQVKTSALSQRLAEQREATRRLQQLQQYLDEYQQNFTARHLPEIKNHRHFSQRLSQAIVEQKNREKEIAQRLKPSYQHWMMAKQRREAVEEAISDSLREEEERQDQALEKDLQAYAARNLKKALEGDEE